MKGLIFLIITMTLIMVLASCEQKEEKYPNEPRIYFKNSNSNQINYTDSNSTYILSLEFTDGDGNIADNPDTTRNAIFIRDSRDSFIAQRDYAFDLPYIPSNLRQKNGGVKGTITLNLNRGFFPLRYDSIHTERDTMYWEVYIMDNDSNRSNLILTPEIYIGP